MSRGQYEFDVWSYIARMGIRLRPARDTFFLDGDAVCAMRTCQYITQEDCEEFLHVDYKNFCCSAPGCQATFSQLIDSEAHYNAVHRHSCSVCKKSLPTSHLLELHVTETHDSYFQVMSVKKPSFDCFLEKCNLRFWNADDRKQHSINEHSFPADFKFDTRDKNGGNGHKKKNSKSLAKKKSSVTEEKMDETAPILQKVNSQELKEILKPSMEVDETVINSPSTSKSAAVEAPKSPPKSRPEEVRLRQPAARQSPSHKIRPASAYIPSLSKEYKSDQNNEKTRIPVSSRTPPTYHRRLSLNTGAAASNKQELQRQTQSPPVKRAPFSLARMGERVSLYGGSSIDVSSDKIDANSMLPLAGSVSTTAIHSTSTLPRTRIPSPTKMAGDSSTLKKCSTSSIPSTPNKKKSNEEKPAQKFASEGTFTKKFSNEEYSPRKVSNESAKKLSCEESPAKSRIPVLRSSSYRVPKTISFGFGVQKVFPMHGKKSADSGKHWHQIKCQDGKNTQNRISSNIENTNFDDMKMALD